MGSFLPELKEHFPVKLRHSQKHTTPLCVYGFVGGQEINKLLVGSWYPNSP